MAMRQKREYGFTLIELIIVVLVIGILAAIAIPSYQDYVTRSRRAEAQSYMMELAMSEEKWRANNSSYGNLQADGSISSGAAATRTTTYYNYTIAAGTNTYTITATARGVQATRDVSCSPLTLTQDGAKTPTTGGCWKS